MGIDYETAKWLQANVQLRGKRVLTCGRQNWWLSKRESAKLGWKSAPVWSRTNYADDFFAREGALCHSVDLVADEHPTFREDLGCFAAIEESCMRQRYNIVMDFGTAEHIADQTAYWENLWDALVPDQSLCVGILPANSLCGHGLYQYSPEFFHNFTGFKPRGIWLVTYGPRVTWKPWKPQGRFQSRTWWPTYVAFILEKCGNQLQMPLQFQNATTPTSREKPWAKHLVELPGIRFLERLLR